MRVLKHLFDNNRTWADRIRRDDPDFFSRLAAQQAPRYLWIGCSDSRVPANTVTATDAGDIFVHRNINPIRPSKPILVRIFSPTSFKTGIQNVIFLHHLTIFSINFFTVAEPILFYLRR